ncbi:hypothetical protein AGLY_009306 [Aphis glycines]|uniref:SNRNP25 ubiquitin-like domain-containing protein n=1 Tax=Aphis glycines TaxID=307491 RepID=A0A6G0TI09_APHGL|nr:hypothetical protein AGLY_009306 [Aphis glycines]
MEILQSNTNLLTCNSTEIERFILVYIRPKSYGVEVRDTLDKLRVRSCSRHVLTGDWQVAMLQDTYIHYTGHHIVININALSLLLQTKAPSRTAWGTMCETANPSSSCTLSELGNVDVIAIGQERHKDLTDEVSNERIVRPTEQRDIGRSRFTYRSRTRPNDNRAHERLTAFSSRSLSVQMNRAKVADLKNSILRKITIHLKRANERAKTSWRRIWKTYWLSCDGQKLKHDHDLLSKYMENNSKLKWKEKLKKKKQCILLVNCINYITE